MLKKLIIIGLSGFLFLFLVQSANYTVIKKTGHFHEGGLSDSIIYVCGLCTLNTDTVTCSGFGWFGQDWAISQANDSISIICSLYTRGRGGNFSVRSDMWRSRAYSALSFSAPESSGTRIAYPPSFQMFWKIYSTADTGDSAETILPYYLEAN